MGERIASHHALVLRKERLQLPIPTKCSFELGKKVGQGDRELTYKVESFLEALWRGDAVNLPHYTRGVATDMLTGDLDAVWAAPQGRSLEFSLSDQTSFDPFKSYIRDHAVRGEKIGDESLDFMMRHVGRYVLDMLRQGHWRLIPEFDQPFQGMLYESPSSQFTLLNHNWNRKHTGHEEFLDAFGVRERLVL